MKKGDIVWLDGKGRVRLVRRAFDCWHYQQEAAPHAGGLAHASAFRSIVDRIVDLAQQAYYGSDDASVPDPDFARAIRWAIAETERDA